MSGASNVIHYLKSRSLPYEQDVIDGRDPQLDDT